MNTELLTKMREYSSRSQEKRKPLIKDFAFKEPLTHGWLLYYLIHLEEVWGRWNYWGDMQQTQALSAEPIPRIEWTQAEHQNNAARKMLERSLDGVTRYGDWHGWSGSTYFDYFMDWLLFGFGCPTQTEEPKPPGGCEGASERLYQLFDLTPLLCLPHDYFGDILAESGYGKHQGFFPTPMNVCDMMTRMQMLDEDMRTKTVCDPCVGTGRFLMCASNYSLRLYGADILQTMCKATTVNLYLYAPWGARPLKFLNQEQPLLLNQKPDAPVLSAPEIQTTVQPIGQMELIPV